MNSHIALREYFENSPDLYFEIICTPPAQMTFRYLNRAWKTKLGYEPSEILNHDAKPFIHPDDIPTEIAAGVSRVRLKHKNGSYFTFEWSKYLDETGLYLCGHGHDITEDLKKSAIQERFMMLAENLPVMLTEFGQDARIYWGNKYYRDKFGWTESEIKERDTLPELFEDRHEIADARSFMLSNDTAWHDFELVDKDGVSFHSSWTNIRMKDGHYIGIGQDLTDRRIAEAKLIQASKMASLGEMSAGVSHEINNPLAIIQGSAFRALHNLKINPNSPDVEADLNRIIHNCERISVIVRGLRAFSRSAEHDPSIPTDISTVIDDVLNLAGERFRSQKIDLQVQIDGKHMVECRPVQISQVLMNLLNNAFDAVCDQNENNRKVEIYVSDAKDRIRISVEDSGPPIPAKIRDRLLEPFFTTKDIGKGTGLGLSISKGIIESHHGRLWLDMNSQKTRFVIELPLEQPN